MGKPSGSAPLQGDRILVRVVGSEGLALFPLDDLWAVWEGQDGGTLVLEFDPQLDRDPVVIYGRLPQFADDYADYFDARSRRPAVAVPEPTDENVNKVITFKRRLEGGDGP